MQGHVGSLLLTSHAAVLVTLAMRPEATGRQIAEATGLSQRRVQAIVHTLCAHGYLEAQRVGRRKHYRLLTDRPLGQGPWQSRTTAQLLAVLADDGEHLLRQASHSHPEVFA